MQNASLPHLPKTSHPLRLVFCGTPDFAVPSLAALLRVGHLVELVLTQPDRPQGRSQQLIAPPVKQFALAHGLPVDQPTTIRNNEALRQRLECLATEATGTIDAIIVVAYGRIIPPWMLTLPRLGCLNVHGSLLPKYRGAAPIQWAIASGEQLTGVTTMLLDEGLDTGPTLQHATLPIPPSATAAELYPQLAQLGAALLLSTLDGLAAGTLHPTSQDHSLASLAPILTREDARIHFHRPATEVYNRWRGFQPWPGAFTTLRGKKLTIPHMQLAPSATTSVTHLPGTLTIHDNRLFVACAPGSDSIELLTLQLEGKRAMPAADFLHGFAFAATEILGDHNG